jgi:peptide-methionine (S)-S-oxide reductase
VVGYTGGEKEDPTYRSLGDHTEAIQMEFDPEVVTYEELLGAFWSGHDPGGAVWSRQYMAAVFTHDGRQESLAVASRDRVAAERKKTVTTAVLPAGIFTPAEDYHQKYYLRQDGELMKEYLDLYRSPRDFVRSTAVARVNGYLGGYGAYDGLESRIGSLGLSLQGERRLREHVQSTSLRRACPLPARGGGVRGTLR